MTHVWVNGYGCWCPKLKHNLSENTIRKTHTHKIWENCTKRDEGSKAGDGERTNVHNQVCNKRHCSLSFLFFITHQQKIIQHNIWFFLDCRIYTAQRRIYSLLRLLRFYKLYLNDVIVSESMCVYKIVCVKKKEREGERGGDSSRGHQTQWPTASTSQWSEDKNVP